MNDIVLEASVVNVEPQTEVLVDAVSDAEAVVLDAVVRLENNEFVLSSGGMYGGGELIGSIPAWVLEAVNQRLTTGDGNIAGLVNDLQTALDALEAGVRQSISNLESDILSQSGLITSLRSDVDGNNADIMNVLATKVTADEAEAVALSAIQSKFGTDVDAYIGNIASTYVDADSAVATEIDLMQASLNGVTANITDISSITIETVQNPLWVDDGNGTDPDVNDEPRWIDQAKAKKQLEVNADGVITGLLLESGQTSSVTVQADEFKLVATGQSAASRNPFTVNATTGEITFVGVVDFTNTNATGITKIDGGKIESLSITADQIAANTITADRIQSVDIDGQTIRGNIILGSYIEGSVIKSSWIDYTTTGSLTNWQYYTPATIPSEYAANFAHNNDGTLVQDGSGYVRLQGISALVTNFSTRSSFGSVGNSNVFSYASYMQSNDRRCITESVILDGSDTLLTASLRYQAENTMTCKYSFSSGADTYLVRFYSNAINDSSHIYVYKNGTTIGSYVNSGSHSIIGLNLSFSFSKSYSNAYFNASVNLAFNSSGTPILFNSTSSNQLIYSTSSSISASNLTINSVTTKSIRATVIPN